MNAEAVIKFSLEHQTAAACKDSDIEDLERWRTLLLARGFIGRDPARYRGLGFGNLSKRMENGAVLITGSQTGQLKNLTPAQYAKIMEFDPGRNWLHSVGLVKPSSEAMTHVAVYQSVPKARYVFHTHCPGIWSAREELNIPTTDSRYECGTSEMFFEVRRLLLERNIADQGILAMGGHEHGIITWGPTADRAGAVLLLFSSAHQG
jgi:hypothetical protein